MGEQKMDVSTEQMIEFAQVVIKDTGNHPQARLVADCLTTLAAERDALQGRVRELEEERNRVFTLRDLARANYSDDSGFLKRIATLEAENAALLWIANCLLGDWPESCGDLDGFEVQDLMIEAGVLTDGTVEEADLEHRWPGDAGLGVGDHCYRLSKLGERVRNATKPGAARKAKP